MFYCRLVLKNVKCNKLKYLLMTLGILASVIILFAILVFSDSFKGALYNEMKVSDERVLTIALGDKSNSLNYKYLPVFTDEAIGLVEQDADIIKSVGVKGANVAGINYCGQDKEDATFMTSTLIYGAKEEFLDLFDASIKAGEFCKTGRDVVIGANIAKAYESKIGDTLKVKLNDTDEETELTVVGILDELKEQAYSSTPSMINNLILVNIDNKIIRTSKYIFISALVNEVGNIESTVERLETQLNEKKNLNRAIEKTLLHVVVVSRLDVLKMIDGWFVYVNLFIGLLGVIICFIVVLNLSNLMILTIMQRKKEIGVMKIIGGNNRQISFLYLIECVGVGVIGTAVGLIISVLTGYLVAKQLNWPYNIRLSQLALILLITIGSPLISGFITQLRIKRMSLIDAFTYD